MNKEVEVELEVSGVFSYDLNLDNASFTYEDGVEKRQTITLNNFSVIVWINGIDYDITGSFTKEQLELFKQSEMKKVLL